MSSVKSFAKFLFVRDLIENAITIEVQLPKIKRRIPTYVKENDMNQLLDELKEKAEDYDTSMAYVIVSMFYYTGMRRSELISILDSNVALSSSEVKVMGKGGKERVVPISRELVRILEDFRSIKLRNSVNSKLFFCKFILKSDLIKVE